MPLTCRASPGARATAHHRRDHRAEYKNTLRKILALTRRFQTVQVHEPDNQSRADVA